MCVCVLCVCFVSASCLLRVCFVCALCVLCVCFVCLLCGLWMCSVVSPRSTCTVHQRSEAWNSHTQTQPDTRARWHTLSPPSPFQPAADAQHRRPGARGDEVYRRVRRLLRLRPVALDAHDRCVAHHSPPWPPVSHPRLQSTESLFSSYALSHRLPCGPRAHEQRRRRPAAQELYHRGRHAQGRRLCVACLSLCCLSWCLLVCACVCVPSAARCRRHPSMLFSSLHPATPLCLVGCRALSFAAPPTPLAAFRSFPPQTIRR